MVVGALEVGAISARYRAAHEAADLAGAAGDLISVWYDRTGTSSTRPTEPAVQRAIQLIRAGKATSKTFSVPGADGRGVLGFRSSVRVEGGGGLVFAAHRGDPENPYDRDAVFYMAGFDSSRPNDALEYGKLRAPGPHISVIFIDREMHGRQYRYVDTHLTLARTLPNGFIVTHKEVGGDNMVAFRPSPKLFEYDAESPIAGLREVAAHMALMDGPTARRGGAPEDESPGIDLGELQRSVAAARRRAEGTDLVSRAMAAFLRREPREADGAAMHLDRSTGCLVLEDWRAGRYAVHVGEDRFSLGGRWLTAEEDPEPPLGDTAADLADTLRDRYGFLTAAGFDLTLQEGGAPQFAKRLFEDTVPPPEAAPEWGAPAESPPEASAESAPTPTGLAGGARQTLAALLAPALLLAVAASAAVAGGVV